MAGVKSEYTQRAATIVYWAYISNIVIQGVEVVGFIISQTTLYPLAADPIAEMFVRATGITLGPLLYLFWSFRNIPLQHPGPGSKPNRSQQSCDLARKVAKCFVAYHVLVTLIRMYSEFSLGTPMTYTYESMGIHFMWAASVVYALMLSNTTKL